MALKLKIDYIFLGKKWRSYVENRCTNSSIHKDQIIRQSCAKSKLAHEKAHKGSLKFVKIQKN
jgi:hypothetical protein